jgi:hypothetical protein
MCGVVVCHVKGDCGPGYYQDDSAGNTSHPLEFSSADLRCLKCPSGADCSNAGTKCSTLATVSGYWRAINNDTINTGSLSYYRCRVAGYKVVLQKHNV